MRKHSSDTQKSMQEYAKRVRLGIRGKHEAIADWMAAKGLKTWEQQTVSTILRGRLREVNPGSSAHRVLLAIEQDFGVTPEQLGIKVVRAAS